MLETAVRAQDRVTTLEDLSPAQIAAIRSIPAHDAAPPPPAIDDRRPASIFTDQARFDLEQARLFRRLPVAVAVSDRLREPGSVIAHDGYGVPLLISRAKDGEVRAFLNACKHKGAKLVDDCERHKASRLTCPYHAWTYALDGSLVGVPREETLKNFDKREFGLTRVPCREFGGLIWVILDPEAEPDFSLLTTELEADLSGLRLPSAHLYGHKRFDLKANWKAVLEPFLEGYHVQRLHARSIGDMFADTPSVTDNIGLHTRQVSGKVNFEPEMLDAPGENIHKTVTHAYQLFPNTVVVTSPYYISVMIIMPAGPGRSKVDYFMVTPTAPDTKKAKEVYERSYELILKVFGTEDFYAAELSQAGLESGALKEVVYCGLEQAIPIYYGKLEAQLGL